MDYLLYNNNHYSHSTQKDLSMPNEFTEIPRSDLLNKIDELQDYFDIDMSKSIIADNSLPCYFSVSQLNENTVVYDFEIDEGSAQIVVYNFGIDEYEYYEENDTLVNHLEKHSKNRL